MKNILMLCVALLVFGGCSDSSSNLTDLNVDTKNPEKVPANGLIANATVELFDMMTSTNVNVNNFRLWAQHWAQVSYSDESNYELVERNVNGRTFRTLYATVVRDIKEARNFINDDTNLTDENKNNQLAIIDVIEVISYTTMVDIFGDVPFTEAYDPANVTPAYDDDAAIYDAMLKQLDGAIGNLGGDAGNVGDLVYGSNGDAWKMLANSFKLRLALRMADTNDALAKTMFETAAAGAFGSNADNFSIPYESSTPNTNPLWEDLVESGRSDFVSGNTLVDYMNDLNDPRRPFFFKPNVTDEISGEVMYVGGTVGAVNSFVANSQVGALLHEPTLPGTIMGYTEVRFLLADAVERGYNVGGTAEAHYNAAVTNSILEWGGTQEDADAYLAQPDVAYATAPGNWKEKIALQKWIALYNQGFEAWTTFRVYDAPTMNLAATVETVPPSRFTYPTTEYSVNEENVVRAASAMGGDDKFSKVFWDKN